MGKLQSYIGAILWTRIFQQTSVLLAHSVKGKQKDAQMDKQAGRQKKTTDNREVTPICQTAYVADFHL